VAVDAARAKGIALNFCAIASKRLGGSTWLLEVNVNDEALSTGRMGSKPGSVDLLGSGQACSRTSDRRARSTNLLPVSNADAQLLYQLDTASMPPLVRQVFDRNIDFKTSLAL